MRVIAVMVALLWSGMASATMNDWTFCGGGASTSSNVGEMVCKERTWDNVETDGFSIRVSADTALIVYQADKATALAGGTVQLWRCLGGYLPTSDATAANSCTKITDAAWDGTGGEAGTQKFAERVGPGLYWIEIVTQAGAGDEPVLQVQGD